MPLLRIVGNIDCCALIALDFFPKGRTFNLRFFLPISGKHWTATMISMTGENESSGGNDDSNGDEDLTNSEEPKMPVEDSEVTVLKEKIAELESTFKEKKSLLQDTLEQCEEYSKSGYARKVAEMENMKRIRSSIASTSQSSATAAVLRDFLDVYDTLNNLKEKHASDEFGRKYCELDLQQTFSNLGVSEFHVAAGDKVNNFRMKVLEREVSEEFPNDTIVREVSSGLDLEGNVIRAALCVSSLGSDEDEEKGVEDTSEGSDIAEE